MNLYPYQVEGARFLASATSKGALLADEPGLGKTRQAISAAVRFADGGMIVVVCPASAVGVWRREIADVIEGDDGAMQWSVYSYNKASHARGKFAVLIIDEAHYAKTRDSVRTQALFGVKCDGVGGLVERADKVILLTGTPTPNNPSEIWPLARACFPKAITISAAGGIDRILPYHAFVQRYCTTEQNYLGHVKITGGKNLAELRAKLAPYVLRRRKEDVLPDLPAVRFSVLPVEGRIPLSSSDAIDAEVRLIGEALARRGAAGLREIAPHVASLRRVTGLAKVDGVCDWVEDWLAGGGGKLVLFAHHRDVIAALCARLAPLGIAKVTGDTPPLWREGVAKQFQDDPKTKVFIGQNEAAGVAITLTASSTLLSLEPAWTPGVNDQIWQRIHRIGQANACDVRYPTIAGSIDEQVTRALIPKQGAIDALWNEKPCA